MNIADLIKKPGPSGRDDVERLELRTLDDDPATVMGARLPFFASQAYPPNIHGHTPSVNHLANPHAISVPHFLRGLPNKGSEP